MTIHRNFLKKVTMMRTAMVLEIKFDVCHIILSEIQDANEEVPYCVSFDFRYFFRLKNCMSVLTLCV